MPTLQEHAREMREDLNAVLPNGVGNTIDALCDALDAAEKREQWLIEQLAQLWKLSEKNVRALLNKDLPRARSTGGDGDE